MIYIRRAGDQHLIAMRDTKEKAEQLAEYLRKVDPKNDYYIVKT